MIIFDCEQRSIEWYNLRKGVITASNAHKLLTPAKIKTYQTELLAEILTGQLTDHFVSDAMQWGIDQEPMAIDRYIQSYENMDAKFKRYGFVKNEKIPNIGCSPDLVVECSAAYPNINNLIVEVKCLSSKNHLEAYMNQIDAYYYAQIQFQMLVMDFEYADYVGYDPRMPLELQLDVKTIERDSLMINKLKSGIDEVNFFIDNFLMERGIPREPRKIVSEEYAEAFY